MSVNLSEFEVTLIIDGTRIDCTKQWLTENSTYFQSMFSSNFSEKNKKEIEIKGIALEDFKLFLDANSGINSVSDENIENALALSAFLGSSELEKQCMDHLAQRSEIPLKEQFQLAEVHVSENLMIQVCSSIKDAYELDEVVPKDLDSFCNRTKNIVMQRSFELLGIRKSPLPPQQEEPVRLAEEIMNELLDQADLQHQQGMILADQAALLKEYIVQEEFLYRKVPEAGLLFQQDPRIHELIKDLRNTQSSAERNAVRAQIQVVILKIMYTKLSEKEEPPHFMLVSLEKLYRIIIRNRRNHHKSEPSVRGELIIDYTYRRNMGSVDESLSNEATPPNNGIEPIWLTKISEVSEELSSFRAGIPQGISDIIPEHHRGISEGARFQELIRFVQIARESLFMGWLRRKEDNRNQNQAEENMQE